MKPICSILLPTRNRPQQLQETIASFLDLAKWPERVEILVRIHENDSDTRYWALGNKRARVITGDDEDGYGSVYKFNNCLAAMSNGEWIWCGTDDAVMLTPHWDLILASHLPFPAEGCLLLTPTIVNIPERRIPVLSRGLYRVLGHVGLSPHCDCYLDALANFAGIRRTVEIRLKDHQSPDVAVRNVKQTWDQYRSEESAFCFTLDKLKIKAVIGKDLGQWTPKLAPELS